MTHEEYLKDLDKELWKIENWKQKGKRSKVKVYNRSLSDIEWMIVKEILQKNIFIVTVSTFRFGFTCGINIIKIIEPVYPGIPFEFEKILSLESYHLPGNNAKFDEGWEEFSLFFNNTKNLEELQRVGLEIPKLKDYYRY